MIDADKTLYVSTVTAINKLRYQAINDQKSFKSLIQAILVNDILTWSQEKESIRVKNHLQSLRDSMLIGNPIFNVHHICDNNAYINVNTPQTNSTWKQVWDKPDHIIVSEFYKTDNSFENRKFGVNDIIIQNLI